MSDRLMVWTDGSFHTGSCVGGWAWRTRDGAEDSGSVADGITSEYMELLAIRKAIEAHQGQALLVLCDHAGIVRNLNRERKDFRLWATGSRRREDVRPILLGLDLLLSGTDVRLRWTRGHAGDPHNRAVDRLSRQARWHREAHPNALRYQSESA